MFIVLVGCIWWLVAVDMGRSGAIDVFKSKTSYNKPVKPVQYKLQATAPVQKTQSGARLHSLSNGVEITPIEMLRSGTLSTKDSRGLICVYNCDNLKGVFYE